MTEPHDTISKSLRASSLVISCTSAVVIIAIVLFTLFFHSIQLLYGYWYRTW